MSGRDRTYQYRRREPVEPDWRRFPAWRSVSAAQWRDDQWQRAHSVRNVRQLREALGPRILDTFYADVERDQSERATMPLLLPPQTINTMVPSQAPDTDSVYADPVRRYMLPVFSDRHPVWLSHPRSARDSLHEAAMWAVEGLTHRYPTKALI